MIAAARRALAWLLMQVFFLVLALPERLFSFGLLCRIGGLAFQLDRKVACRAEPLWGHRA